MRRILAPLTLAILLAVTVSATAGAARPVRIIDADDAEDCEEFVPESLGVAGVTDDGRTIQLDVKLMIDFAEGAEVARLKRDAATAEAAGNTSQAETLRAQADAKFTQLVDEARGMINAGKTSYAPLKISLNFVAPELLAPERASRTVDAQSIIDLAKAQLGGARPAGIDLVYTLTDLDMTAPGLGNIVAGLADCIGGVRYPTRAFAVGEISEDIPIGPVTFYYEATAKIAAHELGHLMGAHHHYQDCVEGIPSELVEAGEPSPCTLMTNFVDFQSLNFSVLEGAAVRGHAVDFAT